ncbi:MAG: chemotaxis protein CheB [Nitrospirota bacterium]
MVPQRIIALGASAGGIEAVSKIISTLPPDIPAPLFVVLHVGPGSHGVLDQIFSRAGSLKAKYAENGEQFRNGTVYIAPADFHLIVKDGHVLLTRGPRENLARPAIDPLFRSAAASHDSHMIGVVLSGMLDDGTAGLYTVKRCGGITCVQDPADASYPDMPRNAIENVKVDYVLPAVQMGPLLNRIVREPLRTETNMHIPDDVFKETQIAESALSDISIIEQMGDKAPFVCPDCGGGLWEVKNDPIQRYRCNTGHAFTIRTLLASQNESLERALWAAVRTLEERANMLKRLADDSRRRGRLRSYTEWEKEAEESKKNAQHIRELLLGTVVEPAPPVAGRV